MFTSVRTALFDLFKRWRMESYYRRERVWGRTECVPDIESALRLASDRRYTRCLDAGTGLGQYAEGAAKFCDAVLAIDISTRAIMRARRRLTTVPNIEFRTANLRTLSAEPFDLIILGDMLYYLGDVRLPREFDSLLRKIVALLAPGGRLLLSNGVTPGRSEAELRAYVSALTALGMHVEREAIFSAGKLRWIQTLMVRETDGREM